MFRDHARASVYRCIHATVPWPWPRQRANLFPVWPEDATVPANGRPGQLWRHQENMGWEWDRTVWYGWEAAGRMQEQEATAARLLLIAHTLANSCLWKWNMPAGRGPRALTPRCRRRSMMRPGLGSWSRAVMRACSAVAPIPRKKSDQIAPWRLLSGDFQ